ncbi:hypothetical protein BU23DRAFT_581584 [Bimuria novae-zelandiae CBS 107.79]|uniref:Rho-GAP domain-containing protein n=1 Tax=Bimuria novae-zelandiae CBS 107.79 TaxID=1447943 RepID=A0A6A5V3K6_9PLEO|nr:hypothetical protein BU23DRAFT_581584 [Bimuria novae-zelandiae CBS 107.79]
MRESSSQHCPPTRHHRIHHTPHVPALVKPSPPDPTYRSPDPPKKPLRKMPKSSSLSLAMRSKGGKENMNSPLSPLSPTSPTLNGSDPDGAAPTTPYRDTPGTPASPKPRKDSKSIFSNFSATRSSSRITNVTNPENSSRPLPDHREGQTAIYVNGRSGNSTPDLSRPVHTPNSDVFELGPFLPGYSPLTSTDNRSESLVFEQGSGSARSTEATDVGIDTPNSKRDKSKPNKKGGMLGRSRSIKTDEGSGRTKLNKAQPANLSPDSTASWTQNGDGVPPKSAPMEKDKSWRSNKAFGKLRTHSADRHDSSQLAPRDHDERRDRAEQSSVASSSFNESRGAQLMSNMGSGAMKVGEKLNSARKGLFGKLGRSSSNHERELQIPKEQYQFKIIHMPLVEQTRMTRISSRLENSKDKTEFWMPALPWRCIDYLNMRGCEEEGLYRVPGAAHQIRYYEQKFDQDRDIDLIADENLNDPNVIGSLFKNWLRQLPDEIFPKAIQARIQQECQGAKSTPQLLKDELSRLPPFNYYLLFAITCHISLLHSCSEFNKMNYNNLCICFQPAIKIDAFCFQFLILDWRNCWQGCWTEKEYLAEEVKLMNAIENQTKPQPTPSRNGHSSGKIKGSHSSGYLGDNIKSSSARNDSRDRKAPSSRGVSSDRSLASERATPPNSSFMSSERSNNSKRRGVHERDTSSDRALSSADSREMFNARATPVRAPPSARSDAVDDEDVSATPTQAQHSRGPSESQFRLDLSNPPSSPFSIDFNGPNGR